MNHTPPPDRRIRATYLWWPRTEGHVTRWLEWATIEETSNRGRWHFTGSVLIWNPLPILSLGVGTRFSNAGLGGGF